MNVGVEKNRITFCNILMVLLSLLEDQEHESVVEGSDNMTNIFVFLFENDGKCFLLKHR